VFIIVRRLAWFSIAQGGKGEHGFMAGFLSSLSGNVGHGWNGIGGIAGRTAIGAATGAAVSRLGGGSFGNGAVTGAFTVLFNDVMHRSPMTVKPLDLLFGYGTTAELNTWFTESMETTRYLVDKFSYTLSVGGLMITRFTPSKVDDYIASSALLTQAVSMEWTDPHAQQAMFWDTAFFVGSVLYPPLALPSTLYAILRGVTSTAQLVSDPPKGRHKGRVYKGRDHTNK
jgi:hypothetical protein